MNSVKITYNTWRRKGHWLLIICTQIRRLVFHSRRLQEDIVDCFVAACLFTLFWCWFLMMHILGSVIGVLVGAVLISRSAEVSALQYVWSASREREREAVFFPLFWWNAGVLHLLPVMFAGIIRTFSGGEKEKKKKKCRMSKYSQRETERQIKSNEMNLNRETKSISSRSFIPLISCPVRPRRIPTLSNPIKYCQGDTTGDH